MIDYAEVESAAAARDRVNKVIVLLGSEKTNLLTSYGLWLKRGSPKISAPEVESLLEYPNGYDFVYNFTQAVDGQVHFKSRMVTMSLVCLRPKNQWDSIRGNLESALQGQWLEFWFTRYPDQHYRGLFEVDFTPGDKIATVDISATCAA